MTACMPHEEHCIPAFCDVPGLRAKLFKALITWEMLLVCSVTYSELVTRELEWECVRTTFVAAHSVSQPALANLLGNP